MNVVLLICLTLATVLCGPVAYGAGLSKPTRLRQQQFATYTPPGVAPFTRSFESPAKLLKELKDALSDNFRTPPPQPRRPPSSLDVMEAAYARAVNKQQTYYSAANSAHESPNEVKQLVSFFEAKLLQEDATVLGKHGLEPDKEKALLRRQLASAMAALSGLEGAAVTRSLLTAETNDRTIRVYRRGSSRKGSEEEEEEEVEEAEAPVSPAEVTRFCKFLGSGKLNRVQALSDGSAVFDLTATKAASLLRAFHEKALSHGSSGSRQGGVFFDSSKASAEALLHKDTEQKEQCEEWFLELPVELPLSL